MMDDKYYNSITSSSSLSIPGLFNNFALPAKLLRLAREHHDFPDFNVVFFADNNSVGAANNESTSAYANDVINNFYELLDKVEAALFSAQSSSSKQQQRKEKKRRKFLIEVEGLDGSGKTTLVNKLQETLLHLSNNATTRNNNKAATTKVIATKTPTKSLHNIRPLFDKCGGILARAFYMISNYILEYEILYSDLYNATAKTNDDDDDETTGDDDEEEVVIIIIDRWYASTCAYTVARPPKSAVATDNYDDGELKQQQQLSIADMPHEIFDWPKDLQLKPNLLLVLSIDQEERQKRVDYRARRVSSSATTGTGEQEEGGPSRFNPWDDRLAKDTALGERILEALHRIRGPIETHSIDANRSIEDVLGQTLDVVKSSMERQFHYQPHRSSSIPQVVQSSLDHPNNNPLQLWRNMAQEVNCCDEYGKRLHHALWNLQVSYNNRDNNDSNESSVGQSIPVLKTVGLDRIDSNFIYYWTASSTFPSENTSSSSDSIRWGSILWMGGTYPTEFQWRAEGYLTRVTDEECKLREYSAPPSLVAHVSACTKLSQDGKKNRMCRVSRPDSYDDAVRDARNVDAISNNADCVCMVRFVPIRIELLRGGPSTRLPGYPQRWEWSRRSSDSLNATDSSRCNSSWTIRSILPFGPTPTSSTMRFRKLTICIVGTHTSGKSTIGRKLAKLLGCQFDGELGETERDSESLVGGGHLHGDGSSATSKQSSVQNDWDDYLHRIECERDILFQDSNNSTRVVETWHVGNGAWYNLRQQHKQKNSSTELERYKIAIAKHQESSLVLVIQLTVASPSTMIRRRALDTGNSKRLPMQDEEKECNQLFLALQDSNLNDVMLDSFGIPLLQIDNDDDGGEAMEKILLDVLSFVQTHLHRQVAIVASS